MSANSRDLNRQLIPSNNNIGQNSSSPPGNSVSSQDVSQQRDIKKHSATKGRALFSLISKKCKIKSSIEGNRKSLWYSMGAGNSKVELSCELEDFTQEQENTEGTKNGFGGKVELLLLVSPPCDKNTLSEHKKSLLSQYHTSGIQEHESEPRATKLYCVFNSDVPHCEDATGSSGVAKGDIDTESE